MNIGCTRSKAQVGMEYMLIFGFSLIIIAILWTYSSSNIESTRWDLQVAYAKSAVDKIVDVADVAYVQGPPAQFYVYPNFPDNANNVYISGKTISIELLWNNGILRNISATSLANLTGSISNAQSGRKILVKPLSNSVQISEA
jgi:uncharacterized protein (UPF0333 family)